MIERTILIARHGSREDFEDPQWLHRAENPYDPDLSAAGIEEAKRLAERVACERIGSLYSSPYLRVVHTASFCAEALGLSIRIEAGFGEWHNSDWFDYPPQTRSPAELKVRFAAVDDSYRSVVEPDFPESKSESIHRFGRTIDAVLGVTEGTILIVGHGATVEGIAVSLLAREYGSMAAPASLCRMDLEDGTWRLRFLNDTSHLAAVGYRPRG